MPLIFEYREKDTFLHKLNPLTAMAILLCALVLAAIWWDLRLLSPLFIVVMVLVKKAGVPRSWFKFLSPIIFLLLIVGIPVVFLMPPEYVSVLPPDVAKTNIGFIQVASIYWLIAYSMKSITMISTAAFVTHSISPYKLTNVLREKKFPPALISAVLLLFRFGPFFSGKITQLRSAQQLRGADIKTKNPLKIIRAVKPLMRPIVTFFATCISTISIAMSTRGFGKVKSYSKWKTDIIWPIRERILTISLVAMVITAIILWVAFGLGPL